MEIVCCFCGDEYEVPCNTCDWLLRGFWSPVSEFVLRLFIYCLEHLTHPGDAQWETCQLGRINFLCVRFSQTILHIGSVVLGGELVGMWDTRSKSKNECKTLFFSSCLRNMMQLMLASRMRPVNLGLRRCQSYVSFAPLLEIII